MFLGLQGLTLVRFNSPTGNPYLLAQETAPEAVSVLAAAVPSGYDFYEMHLEVAQASASVSLAYSTDGVVFTDVGALNIAGLTTVLGQTGTTPPAPSRGYLKHRIFFTDDGVNVIEGARRRWRDSLTSTDTGPSIGGGGIATLPTGSFNYLGVWNNLGGLYITAGSKLTLYGYK